MMPAASPAITATPLEWAVGSRAYAGCSECGDAYVVAPFAGGALVGVVDGLGHGPEAARAAHRAVAVLEQHAADAPAELLQRCHEQLRPTRGAVASIARFHAATDTMTWLGVGNVEGLLYRATPPAAAAPGQRAAPARESLLMRGGVIGYNLPQLRATTLRLAPGDMLMLATDGIAGSFAEISPIGRPPQEVADEILRRCGRTNDDSLIFVGRYLGARP